MKISLAGPVDPDYLPVIERLMAEEGSPGIELLGAIDPEDMPRVYAAADLCVVPSLPPAAALPDVPLALLEAMACRRAVVAPRREEIADVLAEGEGGVLFAPGDAADLARALDALLGDPARCAALADAGYALVRRRYTASAVRRHLLEAYARLIPPSAWFPPQAFSARPRDALQSPAPDVTDPELVIAIEPSPSDTDAQMAPIILAPAPADDTPLPFWHEPAEHVALPEIVEISQVRDAAMNLPRPREAVSDQRADAPPAPAGTAPPSGETTGE